VLCHVSCCKGLSHDCKERGLKRYSQTCRRTVLTRNQVTQGKKESCSYHDEVTFMRSRGHCSEPRDSLLACESRHSAARRRLLAARESHAHGLRTSVPGHLTRVSGLHRGSQWMLTMKHQYGAVLLLDSWSAEVPRKGDDVVAKTITCN
jgi:hypothetical protein